MSRAAELDRYRTRRGESGLLVDYTRDGRPIGIEITTPAKTSLAAINRLLKKLDLPFIFVPAGVKATITVTDQKGNVFVGRQRSSD